VDVNDYRVGRRQIWLDDISCDGTESDISECSHAGWGVHNCEHYEDVAISCVSNSSATSFTTGIMCKFSGVPSDVERDLQHILILFYVT